MQRIQFITGLWFKTLALALVLAGALFAASPALAQSNSLVETDLTAERQVDTHYAARAGKCPFPNEFNADGSRNWGSTSLENGALDRNATYSLQQLSGYPYSQSVPMYDVQVQRFGNQCIPDGVNLARDLGGLDVVDTATGKTPREYIQRGLTINQWAFDRQEANGSWSNQATYDGSSISDAGTTEDLMRETASSWATRRAGFTCCARLSSTRRS
jgi:hypothetical protein